MGAGVVLPAVDDFFGMIRLPRLSARCRGAPRRRGRSGRVWDLVCKRFGCKKPHTSSIRCRGLRSSASDRSFAFGSARTSFLLDAFTTYTNGWIGRGTGVSPREDNLIGLVASLQSRQGYRLAVHTLAAESHALRSCSRLEPLGSRQPPGLPVQASELYHETIK